MRAGIKKDAFDEALIRANYTQKEFSEIVKVSSSYITQLKNPNIEKRRQSCGAAVRRRILKAFGDKYSYDDLFFTFKKSLA